MNVTLICDASYCDRYKVAGYGYWIACTRGKSGGSGRVQVDVDSSGTAEMMAICNTIWRGITDRLIEPGDKLLIQTDCLQAIEVMRGTRGPSHPQEDQVIEYFERTIKRFNLQTEFRHVKGHTHIREARYAANRACDKRAKREMRLARVDKITKEAQEILA